MKSQTVMICLLWQILCGLVQSEEPVEHSDFYKGYKCFDIKMENVMKAYGMKQESENSNSLIHCALSCSAAQTDSAECSYAIYRNLTKTCKLVSDNPDNFTDTAAMQYAYESGCQIMKKTKDDNNATISCQNNGVRIGFTCNCSKGFTGRCCEKQNPHFCQSDSVEKVNPSSYTSMSRSRVPLKMNVNNNRILPVKTFDLGIGSKYYVQAHGHLELATAAHGTITDDFFVKPFNWVFNLHFMGREFVDIAIVDMRFGTPTYGINNETVTLFFSNNNDVSKLVYDGNIGTFEDVTRELSAGYRKFERDFAQVKFDHSSHYAEYENIRTKLKMSSTDELWQTPLTYHTFKEAIGNSTRSVADYFMFSSVPLSSYLEAAAPYWEMDRCWSKVNSTVDHEEFTSVLKEYVERGYPLRMVIGDRTSSDIYDIRATKNDLIAHLPVVLDRWGPYVVEKRSVISRTMLKAECTFAFESSTVLHYDIGSVDEEIDWYVSTRPWVKIYSVDNVGLVAYGNEDDVILAARRGKTIRACVHYSKSILLISCHENTYIEITSAHGALFQTPASFQLEYEHTVPEGNGTFQGIYDHDYRQRVKLLSTKGWIKEATFLPMSSINDVTQIDFDKIDWFMEEDY